MKKIFLIIGLVFGFLAVLIGGIIWLVFSMTADLPRTADAFFKAAGDGDMAAARQYLSSEFQESTSELELEQFLSSSGLLTYQRGRWSNRSINNDRGELEGTVEAVDGGKIPLRIDFIYEDDAWKIYYLERPAAGAGTSDQNDVPSVEIPSPEEQVALVRVTTRDFAAALAEGDMAVFYDTLSNTWREQTSPDELNDIFSGFLEADLRLDLEQMDPQFNEPASIDTNGVLSLVGFYPTEPARVHFAYDYITEQSEWRLFGIRINIRE